MIRASKAINQRISESILADGFWHVDEHSWHQYDLAIHDNLCTEKLDVGLAVVTSLSL